MAKLSHLLLWVLSATVMARGPPPANPKTTALIPFADFDAGEHSYSLSFLIDHKPYSKFYKGMYKETPKVYDDIFTRCAGMGNFSSGATSGTNQMLAATKWTKYGVTFLYTDTIDNDDPIQACIQDIQVQVLSIQMGVGNVATGKAIAGTENAVKLKALKNSGSGRSAGLGAVGIAVGGALYLLF